MLRARQQTHRHHRAWSRTTLRIGISLGVGAISLAACGSSSSPSATTKIPLSGLAAEPASTILATACAATFGAHSMAVASTFGVPSQVGGVAAMHWILTTGSNQGVVLYKGKGTAQAVIMPTISYLKGNQIYWSANATPPRPTAATSLASKWLSIPSSSANNSLMTPIINFASLQSLLLNCVPSIQPTKGRTGVVGSTPTVSLVIVSGGMTQTYFVATSGTPYIVKSTMTGGTTGNETAVLSGFNVQKVPHAPTGSSPLDPLLAAS